MYMYMHFQKCVWHNTTCIFLVVSLKFMLTLKCYETSFFFYRILVRSSDHYLHGLIPVGELDVTQLSREEVVNAISRAMNLQTSFKPAGLPNMVNELLKIDETFVKNKHKVGLLRVKAGQTNEEEIFSNQHEPGPFEEFLGLIGERVKLHGFKKFLGGLDGDRNFTGEESVFMEYKNMEVMFHVATLMPFSANDPQQVRTGTTALLYSL